LSWKLCKCIQEAGLPSRYVHVVGTARPFRTRYNFALYPVVAVLDSDVTFEPFPNDEVSDCFWLPLARFLSAEGHSMRQINAGGVHFSTNVFQVSFCFFAVQHKRNISAFSGQN
jgi:hypothetical protein